MHMHRRVFFIGGFDPKSARHYRRLFKGMITHRVRTDAGEEVQMTPVASTRPAAAWSVRWVAPSEPAVNTLFTAWDWSDIVSAHWHKSLGRSLATYWRYYTQGLRQGFFRRVWACSRATGLLAFFPLSMMVGTAAVFGLLTLALSMGLGQASTPWLWLFLPGWLLGWRSLEQRLDSEWLVRLYGFTLLQAQSRVPELDRRIDVWADALLDEFPETGCPSPDRPAEILVVGHSVGSILAASVVARALQRQPALGASGTRIALLTLGHCTPAVAFFNDAERFRAELALLGATPQLSWADYSAPGDWAAFHTVGPWLRAGAASTWQGSPRFHRILRADSYARIRRNPLRLHLQYLRPAEIVGGYDLLALTCGPQTLTSHVHHQRGSSG